MDCNEARDDGVAVTSAGPYAPRCSEITMPVPHYSIFTGRLPFMPLNQQSQSTEGLIHLRDYLSVRRLILHVANQCTEF